MQLAPLPADEWDDNVQESVAAMLPDQRRNPQDAGNALATLVRHPDLTQAYLPFGAYLQSQSTLPPRLRELAILRVAHHHSCAYEWAHHVVLAKEAGLSDADIARVRAADADDEFERTVLAAVDELHEGSRLSSDTWHQLGEQLDERQRMDFIFTVGGYGVLAMALNTFGVQPEPEGSFTR